MAHDWLRLASGVIPLVYLPFGVLTPPVIVVSTPLYGTKVYGMSPINVVDYTVVVIVCCSSFYSSLIFCVISAVDACAAALVSIIVTMMFSVNPKNAAHTRPKPKRQ